MELELTLKDLRDLSGVEFERPKLLQLAVAAQMKGLTRN